MRVLYHMLEGFLHPNILLVDTTYYMTVTVHTWMVDSLYPVRH